MKHFASALLLSGFMSASMSAAGESAPSSSSFAKAVGVQLQSGYATARSRLLRAAWVPDSTRGVSGVHQQIAFQQYPEVLCGEGYNAVCTGRFEKKGTAILVTINPKTKKLQVTSVDQD